jgi:hypothetical protein
VSTNAWEAPGLSPEERARALWDAIEGDWPNRPDDGRVREREEAIIAAALTAAAADARRGAIEEAAKIAAEVGEEADMVGRDEKASGAWSAEYRIRALAAKETT